jgi:hypothetical protein
MENIPKYLEKICPSAISSTIYPTWTNKGTNMGPYDDMPATNHVTYGMASSLI